MGRSSQTCDVRIWYSTRKRKKARRREYFDVAEQGPQPASVVSGGVQPQYADDFAAAIARPAEEIGREPVVALVPSQEAQKRKIARHGQKPRRCAEITA